MYSVTRNLVIFRVYLNPQCLQVPTEISTPTSVASTTTLQLPSDSLETSDSLPADSTEPAAISDENNTDNNDDIDREKDAPEVSSELLAGGQDEDLPEDKLVLNIPSTTAASSSSTSSLPPAAATSAFGSQRSRSRQQVFGSQQRGRESLSASRAREPAVVEQPRRNNSPRKLEGFSSSSGAVLEDKSHPLQTVDNEDDIEEDEEEVRPGLSLEQNLFQEVQQSLLQQQQNQPSALPAPAGVDPVRSFIGRPLRPVVPPTPVVAAAFDRTAATAVQSSRSRSRASTPAPQPAAELPPRLAPNRFAAHAAAEEERPTAISGGEYEYEYYYDYLDDSPHSTDYDLVPLSAKVIQKNLKNEFTATLLMIILY